MKKTALILLMLFVALVSSCGGSPADTTAETEKAAETTTAVTENTVSEETTVTTNTEEAVSTETIGTSEGVDTDEIPFESLIGKTLGDLEDEYGITFDYAGQYSISHCYYDNSGNFGYMPFVNYMLDDYRVSTVTGAFLGENVSFRGIKSGMSYNEIAEQIAPASLPKPDNAMDGTYCTVFETDGYKVIVEWGEEWDEDMPSDFIVVCRTDYMLSQAELDAYNAQEALKYTAADTEPTFDNIIGRRLNYAGEHFGVEFGYLGQFSFIYDYNEFAEDFPYLPITAFDFFEDENPKIIGAALGKGGNFKGIEAGMTYEEMTEHISADILGRPSFDEESGGFTLTAEVDNYVLYIDWGESYFGDDEPCIFVAAYDKSYPMSEEDGAIYEATMTAVG